MIPTCTSRWAITSVLVVREFVVPGKSRERFINLRDAEETIPALGELLDLAQRGEINLVTTADLNRFRSLTDQVYRTLAAYKCQLYSLAQPVEPQPPDRFNPRAPSDN